MLQSNGDRWPLWDQEFEKDDEVEEGRADEEKHIEHKVANKVTDKKIATHEVTHKERQPRDTVPSGKFSRQDAMHLVNLGTELFASVLVGTLLGWAVSHYIGGGAFAIAVGVVIGAAAGFLNLYRVIVEEERKEEQKRRGSS